MKKMIAIFILSALLIVGVCIVSSEDYAWKIENYFSERK